MVEDIETLPLVEVNVVVVEATVKVVNAPIVLDRSGVVVPLGRENGAMLEDFDETIILPVPAPMPLA